MHHREHRGTWSSRAATKKKCLGSGGLGPGGQNEPGEANIPADCVHDEKGGQKNSAPTLYEMTAVCDDSET